MENAEHSFFVSFEGYTFNDVIVKLAFHFWYPDCDVLDKEATSLHPLSVWFLSLIVLEFPSESSEEHASITPLSTMVAKTYKLFFINRYFL